MSLRQPGLRRRIRPVIVFTGLFVILYLFRRAVFQVGILILGAAVITFLALPFARWFEKRFSRAASALLALMSMGGILGVLLMIILPVMIRQLRILADRLPQSMAIVSGFAENISAWFRSYLGSAGLSRELFSAGANPIPKLASETIAFAGSVADIAGRFSLMTVLSFFFLCDRDTLLLRIELLIPVSHRTIAVQTANAVLREMRMYLRGQLTVALFVALMATVGLALLGVSGSLALGPIIGLLNMIPYFGPFIGGVPAVLAALSDNWQKACLTLATIVVIQQIDNNFISPRVMGNLTGLPPALVLITIYVGSQVAGIVGMLFALPVFMTFRTLFRVFVQRHENI